MTKPEESEDPQGAPEPVERPLFQHPDWMVGVVLILVAVGGSITALSAAGLLREAVDDRASALDQTLVASSRALRTADDTVAIVAGIVEQLVGSLDSLEDAAIDVIATIDDVGLAFADRHIGRH